MQWRLPNIAEKPIPTNFSIWGYLLIFIISILFFGFAVLLINGESVVSTLTRIILYLVVAPLLFSLSITGFLYSYYYYQRIKTLFYNQCIKNKRESWKEWAGEFISLVDYSYVTDIDNIALNIMGLDGQPPMNPDKVLPITAMQNSDGSPLFFLFDKILLPMKSNLTAFSKLTVLLNSTQDEETAVNALVSYSHLHDFNIDESDIVFSPKIPAPDLINEWIDTPHSHPILLINLLLNTPALSPTTEYGCALLFSGSENVHGASQIRLFRPLQTVLPDLGDDFGYLLDCEQVEKDQVGQVWTTFLPSLALDILKTKLFDVDSEFSLDANKFYQLDLYLGKLSDNHAWLALALAAEGITQGQKGQLIAAQNHDNIHIMQLSDKSVQAVEEDEPPFFYPCVYLLSAILCLFSIIALLPIEQVDYLEVFFIIVFGSALFSVVTSISLYYKFVIYQNNFEQQWLNELKKINTKND